MMRRLSSSGIAGIAGVALMMLTACGGNTTPTAPTPAATVTVTSVSLTSAATSTSVVQVNATALFSDGSTRDVTAAATWATSNTAVAVVSDSGRVTIVNNGDVDVRATYQSVMGSLKLVLSQKFVLSGVVTEGPPTNGPLANARVEITAGANAGTFVLTDAAGAFRFNAVTAGAISMQTTKDGYLLWRITNLTMDHDREIDLELFPTPPVNAAGASATARCGDGSWSWAPTRGEACTANGGVVYGVCPGALCDGR